MSELVKASLAIAAILFFAMPVRAKSPELPKPVACANNPAIIKGNVNRKKKKLYYLSTHRTYKRVKINKKNERWFCSEEEALSAGWVSAPPAKQRKLARAVLDTTDYAVPSDLDEPGCDIKGNVSSDAKRYHVRGTPYYAETRIEKARGDRWFCDEDEARSAGFEKAGTYIGGVSKKNMADCVVPDDPNRPPGCTIKGNVSTSGKIYHVLGSKYYAETTITRARGERWFCSEEEAKSSSWRRPKNAGKPLVCPLALGGSSHGSVVTPPVSPQSGSRQALAE